MGMVSNFARSVVYGNLLTAFLRMLCGALFLYSGIFKVLDMEGFGRVVDMYAILPSALVPYAAIVIPSLELILGALLMAGFRIRAASFLSMCLMAVFSVAIIVNIARGSNFDCGCFELSRFGIPERIGWLLVARDALLFTVFALMLQARRHLFSLDYLLEKRTLSTL
ncbi:MAG: DoxX family membrane protein [Spirochaetes bacterium]|nr:MAG: DoxX family membrane protein [Spirochaetota bacterium]